MCERIIARLPSLTAEERLQLRHNCERAVERSPDRLVVLEAKRVLAALDTLQQREARVLARLPLARRIEYAFRRLPASDDERRILRLLIEQETKEQGAAPRRAEAESFNAGIWHRRIGDICRMRRHLLGVDGPPQAALAEQPASGPAAWATALLSADDGGNDDDAGSIRLRPEALAAFSSLGYIGEPSAAAAA